MSTADPRFVLDPQSCVRGEAHRYAITVMKTNADGSTSPVDLTTYGTTWTAMLRGDPDYATSTSWTIDSSQANIGKLVLSLTGAQTLAMPHHATGTFIDDDFADTFLYDIEVTGGAVSPQYPYVGMFRLWKAYTHG